MHSRVPLVIAHRGASGYLPEHTLEAKAFAYAQQADFLEQDVVATSDDELVVLHDIQLDRVSNVAELFPGRHRADGRFYVRDFSLAEIRQLTAGERRNENGDAAVYAGRFPTKRGRFSIPTLAEEIELVRGLNQSTGRDVGIYPEIKRPAWHKNEGVDLTVLVLRALETAGYRQRTDNVYLQCFDAAELRRIRNNLDSDLKLIQLIAENSWGESDTDYDALRTPQGLRSLSETVDGVGPWIGHVVELAGIDGHPVSTGFVSAAQQTGLEVHPYTFRAEELVPGFESLEEMVHWFAKELQIDGLFTDFPDQARRGLDS